jgi:tRNA nucleotidyltransferase/poly(A) polymerase
MLSDIINKHDILKYYRDTLYISGGFVRDYLYSEFHKTEFTFNDYDFVTSDNILSNDTLNLTSIQKKYYFYNITDNITINSFRSDIVCYGRKADVEYTDDIIKDSNRRDFNINSIYYKISTNEFIDLHNGINDVKLKRFRFIGDPLIRVKEDKSRGLRKESLINKGFEYYNNKRAEEI